MSLASSVITTLFDPSLHILGSVNMSPWLQAARLREPVMARNRCPPSCCRIVRAICSVICGIFLCVCEATIPQAVFVVKDLPFEFPVPLFGMDIGVSLENSQRVGE